jgi:hypothetical protein
MKARLLLAAAALALVASAPAGAADRVVERGILQSIDRSTVVLRALDGTDVAVRIVPRTRFRLNGSHSALADIRPGLVAEVVTAGSGGPALVVRAFGDVDGATVRGVLLRVAPRGVLLRRPSGRTARIPIGARTTVWRDGTRVRVRVLRAGMRVEVYRAAGGVARVVVIR